MFLSIIHGTAFSIVYVPYQIRKSRAPQRDGVVKLRKKIGNEMNEDEHSLVPVRLGHGDARIR